MVWLLKKVDMISLEVGQKLDIFYAICNTSSWLLCDQTTLFEKKFILWSLQVKEQNCGKRFFWIFSNGHGITNERR
jgi:hypothetical protein